MIDEQMFRKRAADVQKKFFNKMQRAAMAIGAHDEYLVCSRGTGKSEGVDARFILRNVWEMPGSTGALLSPTYSKAWNNTLPAICHALKTWGYIEGVHYVVGHKAPPSMNFAQPKRPVLMDAYKNGMHFWNGTFVVVLSFNQGMSANSMSLDWVIGPEAKFLDYEKIKSEVNPANRGNEQYFGNCPHHHSVCYTTDMPTSSRGRWILDKEEEMDAGHINYIRNLYRQLKTMERTEGITEEYRDRCVRLLRKDLDLARKFQPPVIKQKGKTREFTVFYGEYDIFDNLEVVGEDYIWQMYRDSPPLIWRTAFLNERLFKVPNGFYSALDDNVHFYIPSDSGTIDSLPRNWKSLIATSANCLGDDDVDYNRPLHMAFDSNAAINSAVVAQKDGHTMKVLHSFFVKTPLKLQELVQNVCDYYAPKLSHTCTVYYDSTFVWETGSSSESYADLIERVFEENGWTVTMRFVGPPPQHAWKHEAIDLALKGDPGYLAIRFNAMGTEFLKLAMEQTGIRQGKNGFEKDKTPEGTQDTPDNPDEYKTHVTDAFDTLWYGMNFYYTDGSERSGGLVFIGR
ncbi:MAG: hypothetical protein K6B45_04765 [Bacteroidaceae bacterium]|nr:hypothetical protein [Bacteroidaceae bacterium]